MDESLLKAIELCNKGLLKFNLGKTRAFLYKKKWYPLRAIINEVAGDKTTDRALVELAYSNPYIRISDIEFQDSYPVELNTGEILSEIKLLNEKINNLL